MKTRAASSAGPTEVSAEIETIAAQWLARSASGLDAAAQTELATWLAANPAHAEAHRRLGGMSAALQRARAQGLGPAISTQLAARRRRRFRRTTLGAAALAVVVSLAVLRWPAGPASTKAVPATMAQAPAPVRTLPDGSVVELNGDAQLSVDFSGPLRRVELRRGEALFHVAKDPSRAFVVRANGVDVRAVGTAFTVRVEPAVLQVLVTEGKVDVDDSSRGESLLPKDPSGAAQLLTAGQLALVQAPDSATSRPSVQVNHVAPEEMKARLAWRPSRIEFEGVTLAEAVAQMNLGQSVRVVADPALHALRVSGTFQKDDPETFARLIAATFDLRVDRHGESEIALRKK